MTAIPRLAAPHYTQPQLTTNHEQISELHSATTDAYDSWIRMGAEERSKLMSAKGLDTDGAIERAEENVNIARMAHAQAWRMAVQRSQQKQAA